MSVKLTDDFFLDMASSPLATAECSRVCLYLYIYISEGWSPEDHMQVEQS